MSLSISQSVLSVLAAAFALTSACRGYCAPPTVTTIKPDVMALIKQSTDSYKKMKSFSADVSLKVERTLQGGSEVTETHFALALDRSNRFCYRNMTDTAGEAAVCDGKRFTNYKSKLNQFTEGPAPADYKGINIVDDVEFEPLGTYIIALMLQGDALADKDVKAGFLKSNIAAPMTENGKKWQDLHMLFGPNEADYDIYIGDDHQIGKTTTRLEGNGVKVVITELLTNIKIDKPIDDSTFHYTPPQNAQKVPRFGAPQRPGDALLTSPRSLTTLAAFTGPPIPALTEGVRTLIDQATAAYAKLTSYRHVAVFRAKGTKDGKPVDQSAKFSLAVVRPNKLAFKMVTRPNVAAVCDGKTFTDFRSGEYVRLPAPPDIKGLPLLQDDFDPVAGSYLIALLLQDKAFSDPKLLGILLKSTVHTGIVADSKSWDALDFSMPDGLNFVLYFDPTTHMLSSAAAKVPDQDLVLTETFTEVAMNKPIDENEFVFKLPATAKKVQKL